MKNASPDTRLQNALLLEKYEPIAIVGIGLRLPGNARTPAEFATLLREGRSATEPIPRDRWDIDAFHSDQPGARGKTLQSAGGFLNHIDQFDPKFFNISPKEADYVDPQHRLLLECGWEALASANIDPASLRDSDGGVYIGIGQNDWAVSIEELPAESLEGLMGAGSAHSAACGRLSYFLGWRGPCLSVDTACSASLAALHLAVQGLRRRECSIALCGGVNIIHHPRNHIMFSLSNMLSADGKCKTFDDSADGYARSEGCAMFALKRLSDAKRDGDPVLALIRGSSVRQDGESGGLTVPNGTAQAALMREALSSGMLAPGDIQYVEAHGTGTPLGDPIEIGAIDKVFGDSHREQALLVGSVKTNIGHMEAAAGVGGLLKVVLQLQEGVIYPHIHLQQPSRHIPWERYHVTIPTEVQPWQGAPRRAMVNSFGFAGTIASVVLEQAPPLASAPAAPIDKAILTISAKHASNLRPQLTQWRKFAAERPELSVAELCYASNVGRTHLNARFAAPVATHEDLLARLDKELARAPSESAGEFRASPVVFLFTGQGSQYLGMGRALAAQHPVFKQHLERCDALFAQPLGCSILALMWDELPDSAKQLQQTLYTQPALFAIEYAMAQLWLSWGVAPSILLGHSIGEIVAATLAGLFTLEDATRLVAARARLMQSVSTPGGMVAVRASHTRVAPALKGHADVSFGAINAPQQCVISGGLKSLALISDTLKAQGIDTKALPVSHAFHSPLMTEVFDAFRKELATIQFHEPSLSFISNLTGEVARFADVSTAEYWVRHIGEPVNFAAGMGGVLQQGKHVFIEVGPSGALCSLGKQFDGANQHLWLASMNPAEEDAGLSLRKSVAQAYVAGLSVQWSAYHNSPASRRMDLPAYVFDRKRHWLPSPPANPKRDGQSASHHPLLGKEQTPAAQREAGVREFRTALSAREPAYLSDHQVMAQVVFPGAGFVEVLLAAQEAVLGETTRAIQNLRIHEPLFLSDEPTDVRTRWQPQADGSVTLQVHSLLGGGAQLIERLHVQATLSSPREGAALTSAVQQQLLAHAAQVGLPEFEHQAEEIYARYANLGLPYGPEFQRLLSVRQYTDGFAIGELRGLDTPANEQLRASVLDCAMQTLAGVVDLSDAYLPVGFECIELLKKPKGDLRCLIQRRPDPQASNPPAELLADLLITDAQRPVAMVQGLKLKRVANQATATRRWLHEPRWLKRSLNLAKASGEPRHLLLLNRSEADFKTVRAELSEAGVTLSFAQSVGDVGWLLTEKPDITDVCWFWHAQPALRGEARLRAECFQNYNDLLQLAATLEKIDYNRPLRLSLVTEGGQCLPADGAPAPSADALAASSVWGFGHVLLNEQPKLGVTLIDLPTRHTEAFDPRPLADEWRAGDASGSEFQIAYRGGLRHVKRVMPLHTRNDDNFELKITEYGQFAHIKPVPAPDLAPQGREVTVEVHAAGLNFKDVLNALGMLKQYAVDNGLADTELPLGFEASGKVVAAGPQASFKLGDEVILSQLGCMKRRVTLSSDMVVLKPDNLSLIEAAALPAAYVTAYHALHHLARIQPGDRVLIHAAAGGVGQAAVQLAQLAGAEVYATASPSKWPLLRAQGVRHIMNSRTLEFPEQIHWATEGRGVTIVLNSLNKEYVPASVKCLSPGGRFVELGKIGIWSPQQMKSERPDVDYHNFDLSEYPVAEFNRINQSILQTVTRHIAQGELRPLPCATYSLDEVEEAFSVLSQGRNQGKLVLTFPAATEAAKAPVPVRPDRTYLVTGGWGALGLEALRKLVQEGARHLAVISRTPPSAEAIQQQARALGAEVTLTVHQGDVSQSEDVARILAKIPAKTPLAGVIHTAGVLADGPVSKQTWDSFERVLQPKVYGTWNLHHAIAQQQQQRKKQPPLDFFITYSSISSVLGAAGQSNYASGNAFMDTLMQWRAAQGQVGHSINWGPWAEVGMAASLSKTQIQGIEERGIKFVKPAQGMRALFDVLGQGRAQTMIGEFDWAAYVGNQALSEALFKVVLPQGLAPSVSLDIEALKLQPKAERDQLIRQLLRDKVASVLRFDSAQDIEADAKFIELGLDSLAAVELKNALESALRMPLPTSALFDYPAIASLTEFISQQLVPTQAQEAPVSEADTAVHSLTDDEADAELAALREGT